MPNVFVLLWDRPPRWTLHYVHTVWERADGSVLLSMFLPKQMEN